MSLGKPTIKLVFMDDEMRDFAINEATKALETSNSEKVGIMKLTWCVVGRIIHEDVVREEIQISLALHSRSQLRRIRDT